MENLATIHRLIRGAPDPRLAEIRRLGPAQESPGAMRPIYTAVNEAAAKAALENLRRDFGKKGPGLVAAWERSWDQFAPFLAFDAAIRTVIYTTSVPWHRRL